MSTNLHIDDIGNLILRDGKLGLSVSSQYATPPHYGGGRVGALSPYAYCAGDPVNCEDLDGRDIFTMDKWGYTNSDDIIPCFETYIIFTDGRVFTNVVELSASDNSYDDIMLNLSDKKSTWSSASSEQVQTLQPILSNNTNVEWGSVETYSGGDGFIGTDHNTSAVDIDKQLGNRQMDIKDVRIRNHSHPDKKTETQSEGNRGVSNKDGRGDVPKFKAQQEKCGATYRAFVHHRATGNIYEYDGTRSVVNVYENSEEWKKDIN